MRDKLIELLCNVKCEGEECFGNCPHRIGQKCNKVQRLEMCSVFAIADHLLANGVIVPPCKVGDVLWYIEDYTKEIKSSVVERLTFEETDISSYTGIWGEYGTFAVPFEDFRKLVFLTREDAEQALKEAQGNE